VFSHTIGPDRARFRLRINDDEREPIDEIDDFWNARYLSATEATWRILGFHVCRKDPAVTPLTVHLPDSIYHARYHTNSQAQSLSKLQHYFARPTGVFPIHAGGSRTFASLLYAEYFTLFRLQTYDPRNDNRPNFFLESLNGQVAQAMHVVMRLANNKHIARIQTVHVSHGDVFYLRALLQTRPASSFDELRTVDGILHQTFQEACISLGIFTDENEADYSLLEAVHMLHTPRQLRILFVHLLTNNCVDLPIRTWEKFLPHFTADFAIEHNDDTALSTNSALEELNSYLEEYGKCTADFGLPQPTSYTSEVDHEIYRWNQNTDDLLHLALQSSHSLNYAQQLIAHDITLALATDLPLLLFIDGKAGRGKTYLVNVLCDWVRGHNMIVLPTATSAFAAQMYKGGRTTHSTFKVSYLLLSFQLSP